MHSLPILYSSCWIVSQSHASLHIVREEKQIFTVFAGKKKKTLNVFWTNMNKSWMQLRWKPKCSREAWWPKAARIDGLSPLPKRSLGKRSVQCIGHHLCVTSCANGGFVAPSSSVNNSRDQRIPTWRLTVTKQDQISLLTVRQAGQYSTATFTRSEEEASPFPQRPHLAPPQTISCCRRLSLELTVNSRP